jgi:hypothetical protein
VCAGQDGDAGAVWWPAGLPAISIDISVWLCSSLLGSEKDPLHFYLYFIAFYWGILKWPGIHSQQMPRVSVGLLLALPALATPLPPWSSQLTSASLLLSTFSLSFSNRTDLENEQMCIHPQIRILVSTFI